MKKFLSGLVVGVILATCVSSYAVSQVVAEYVRFNFVVNGESASVAETPVVISGRSYLPVRAIANLLEHEVDYIEESKTIVLNSVTSSGIRGDNLNLYVNGSLVPFYYAESPILVDGVTYISPTHIAQSIGISENAFDKSRDEGFMRRREHWFTVSPIEFKNSNGNVYSIGSIVKKGHAYFPLQLAIESFGGTYEEKPDGIYIEIEPLTTP